jgi:hypothetical protein
VTAQAYFSPSTRKELLTFLTKADGQQATTPAAGDGAAEEINVGLPQLMGVEGTRCGSPVAPIKTVTAYLQVFCGAKSVRPEEGTKTRCSASERTFAASYGSTMEPRRERDEWKVTGPNAYRIHLRRRMVTVDGEDAAR